MPDARLHVTDPQGRRVVPIGKPLFSIGRRTAADLQIASTDVSRDHAEISQEGEAFVLRDRASRYGTFVNGERVTERSLAHGDRIRLGRTDVVELVFRIEDDDSSALRSSTSDVTDLGQMAAVLNGLRALGSGRVVEEVLTVVIDNALDVTKAERGFIMLANPAGELEFTTARARGHVTLPGQSFTTSAKIPRDVFLTGKTQMVGDLLDAELAPVHDGTIAVGIRHVVCVPLVVAPITAQASLTPHKTIGVLYLDGRERSRMLSANTQSSLEAFAMQAALAIESARLYAEEAEKANTDRDLRVAADIQRALLPEPTYDGPVAELAAFTLPCRTIGGDFFDYLDLPDLGGLAFVLGDVAGKGPPAALLAATLQSHFVAHAQVGGDPAGTVSRINRALLRRAIEARFATMFYGLLRADGSLRYCNAGQEPPALVRANGIEWLEIGGPVVGLLDIATYETGTVPLYSGDLVVVCSDGVTEARSVSGEEFGRERLAEVLVGAHGASADVVLDRVTTAVRQFSHGAAQADDITALVLRFKGSPD